MVDSVLWAADLKEWGSRRLVSWQLARLSEQEKARYRALARLKRRHQFLLGRTLLRHGLSESLGLSPDTFSFVERPSRAPRLESREPVSVSYSLAHSHDRVACLVSGASRCGVDVQSTTRRMDYLSASELVFPPSWVSRLQLLDGKNQRDEFFRFWSASEAFFKAAGTWLCRAHGCFGRGLQELPARIALAATVRNSYALAVAVGTDGPLPSVIRHFSPRVRAHRAERVSWTMFTR